jgi:hypothetical protein
VFHGFSELWDYVRIGRWRIFGPFPKNLVEPWVKEWQDSFKLKTFGNDGDIEKHGVKSPEVFTVGNSNKPKYSPIYRCWKVKVDVILVPKAYWKLQSEAVLLTVDEVSLPEPYNKQRTWQKGLTANQTSDQLYKKFTKKLSEK